MKKFTALTALTSGILLLLVPRYILPACEYEGFPHMHCSDTARAEFIIGAVLIGIGGVAFFFRSAKAAVATAGAAIILYIVSFRLPDVVGYCRSARMPCNYGMVPGIRFIDVVGALMMVLATVGQLRAIRKKGTT